jgi:hypothetical protein
MVKKYWGSEKTKIDYRQIDQLIIKKFNGTHPKVMNKWLLHSNEIFQVDSNYQLSSKQKKHRIMMKVEKLFGIELSKKHFKLI